MSNNDRFEVADHYGVPSLHITVDRSERYMEGHEDLGIEHAYFSLDDVQGYLRKYGFKSKETIDLAHTVMQRAQVALDCVETATESDWTHILSYALTDIIAMCQAQFPQVQDRQ